MPDISDIPLPSRRYTTSYFFVLFFLVSPIWLSVPLSWFYVLRTLLRPGHLWKLGTTGRVTFVLALAESLFSIYHYHLKRRVSGSGPQSVGNPAELQIAFDRMLKTGLANLPEDGFDEESLDVDRPGSPAEAIVALENDDPRAIDYRHSLRSWFKGAPYSALRRQEVYSWLYWSVFGSHLPPLDQLSATHRALLDQTLDRLQKRTGYIIPEGSGGPQPTRLTLDNVNISWRPLWWYMAIAAFNAYLKYTLKSTHNIRYEIHGDMEYFIRIPSGWDAKRGPSPIVVIHGLGLGLLQYYGLFKDLLTIFNDRPLLVPIQPHISQNILHPRFLRPMSRHKTVQTLTSLLTTLGWATNEPETLPSEPKGVTMLSHSNGSYVHAWILKDQPHLVQRSCFVDPVTFCSWEGETCYNFLYKPCRTGIELLMRYFVGSELGVANLLTRHFEWVSNALWFEDIPNARDPSKSFFVLGGKDDIINAARVKRYLTSHGVKKGIHYDPFGRHGQALIGESYAQVLQWLRADSNQTRKQ